MHRIDGRPRETLYMTAYNDGDTQVALFRSEDGVAWTKVGLILSHYDDVHSEAELQFFGENHETAVSLIRLDNQGNLTAGQTAVCTASAPFETWECGRRFEQRIDGPTWVVRRDGDRVRNFVFARKHLACTFKRTAAYEILGDLTDPLAEIRVCEIQELASSGDTAYTALVPLDADRSLLSWYSSPVDQELPWLEGQFSPSDIWFAEVDFRRAPGTCTPAKEDRVCVPPPLPPGNEVYDVTGRHLLAMGPVIWPSEPLLFLADARVAGARFDLTLQPLEPVNLEPVGDPWSATGVPIEADGSFAAAFPAVTLASEAYPILDAPIPLNLRDLVLRGKTTSPDSFCGTVEGRVQLLFPPSDRIQLEGSTFGAVRAAGGSLPAPVSSCP